MKISELTEHQKLEAAKLLSNGTTREVLYGPVSEIKDKETFLKWCEDLWDGTASHKDGLDEEFWCVHTPGDDDKSPILAITGNNETNSRDHAEMIAFLLNNRHEITEAMLAR